MKTETTYYALVIDTDQYSGNFEREMASFCTGLYFPRGAEYVDKGSLNHDDWWARYAMDYPEGEYEEPVAIWPTPGWSNSGMGAHKKLEEGEKMKYPAYQSVAIFCAARPSSGVIDEVKERAELFNDFYRTTNKWAKEDVKILGFRLLEFARIETQLETTL